MNLQPFENTKTAFALKTDAELKKSHFIFTSMGKPWLVQLGSKATMLALKWGLPVKGIIRNTIFEQFCGGVTVEECMPVAQKMYTKGVSTILDYSVEGLEDESGFDAVLAKKMSLIKHAAAYESLPFEVVKPTGIGRIYIWQKITEKQALTPAETEEWNRIKSRVQTLCKAGYDHNVALLFDGEETWMQDAADDIIQEMMRLYNKERAIIYNTVQCYRKDRMIYTQKIYKDAKEHGYLAGLKIVRGAYMEKERARAVANNYESPICDTKADSDAMFNDVMHFILDRLDVIKLCIGTHNESSTLQAMQVLEEKKIDLSKGDVWFGQLYGMSDNLTFNLAEMDYKVFKILPFGPIEEVMPYLIRRAQENTSVAGQTGRELMLVKKEMKRRGI